MDTPVSSKPSYSYWRDALAGKKPKAYVDQPELGFYRKGIYKKEANVRAKRVGWAPVAIFIDMAGKVTAAVGSVYVVDDHVNELWSFVCDNPISEEWYRAVSEEGKPWPDSHEAQAAPAVPSEIKQVLVQAGHNAEPKQAIDVAHAEGIDNAIAVAPKEVKSEQDASIALGSKNRIAELRLAADKAGKAIYDPIYREYTAEQKKWSPIISRATTKEKELNNLLLEFREKERVRIANEQAEAEAKQREIDEANARMADRAIARGEPEPQPVAEEVALPQAAAPLVPTYGSRKLKEDLKKFVIIDDIQVVFIHFKSRPEVMDLLTKLAQAELNSGRATPGTHHREGLI
jgi:hypothetical protein